MEASLSAYSGIENWKLKNQMLFATEITETTEETCRFLLRYFSVTSMPSVARRR